MKHLVFLVLFFSLFSYGDTSITNLPAIAPGSVGSTDVFPFVNIGTNQTGKLQISQLFSVPSLQTPNLTGVIIGAGGVQLNNTQYPLGGANMYGTWNNNGSVWALSVDGFGALNYVWDGPGTTNGVFNVGNPGNPATVSEIGLSYNTNGFAFQGTCNTTNNSTAVTNFQIPAGDYALWVGSGIAGTDITPGTTVTAIASLPAVGYVTSANNPVSLTLSQNATGSGISQTCWGNQNAGVFTGGGQADSVIFQADGEDFTGGHGGAVITYARSHPTKPGYVEIYNDGQLDFQIVGGSSLRGNTTIGNNSGNLHTINGSPTITGGLTISGAAGLTLPAGSVSGPSLNVGNSETGVYQYGTNELGFSTNGFNAAFYDNNSQWTFGQPSHFGSITHNFNGSLYLTANGSASDVNLFKMIAGTSTGEVNHIIQNNGNTRSFQWLYSFGSGTENVQYISDTGANLMTATRAGAITLGATSQTQIINGAVQMPTLASSSSATTGTVCWTTSTGNLTVDTTVACLSSTRKIKEDIEPLDVGLREVMALQPISYHLKAEYNPMHLGKMVGFIAEDVGQVDPRLIAKDSHGDPMGVRYMQLTAVLTKAIQEQQAEIDELKRQITGELKK